VSFPDSFMIEVPTIAAEEILALLDGCPVGPATRGVIAELRGEVQNARDQEALFDGVA
jgi:hypothetical protein